MKNFYSFIITLVFLIASHGVFNTAAVAQQKDQQQQLQISSELAPVSKDKQALVSRAVEKWLKGRYKVDDVSNTPMQNILEVRIGNELIYTDSEALYVIVEGRMIDLKSSKDITKGRLEKIQTIDFSTLPLELAIKTQTESGDADNKKIVVFEDPYCSYCKKYRVTLEKIKNLTIYTFLLPILSEDSVEVSRKIWCSNDRARAWTDFMIKGKQPNNIKEDCEFPKKNLMALGKKLGINATPTSYLISGKRISGAVSKESLEREFGQL